MMKKVSAELCKCLRYPSFSFLRGSIIIEDLFSVVEGSSAYNMIVCLAVVGS